MGHFALSLVFWLMFFRFDLRDGKVDWPMFLHAIPAVILFCCFVLALYDALRRARRAVIVLGLTVCASLLCFLFDTVNHFYQLASFRVELYNNWWWHDLPFKEQSWEDWKYGYINKGQSW
jgi:hypothetical protein